VAATSTVLAHPGSAETIVSRLLHAPPELVFAAFTDPAHIDRWWGPRGFTTTTKSIDLRTGGHWEHVMRAPDGIEFPNYTEYLEVDPPRKLRYRLGDRPNDPNAFLSTVTFTPEEGGTRVELHSVFPSIEARDYVIDNFGALQGGLETLDRFEEHVASTRERHELVVSRAFTAPRSLVWKAYTEPERLKHWWSPGDWTLPVCEVDLRVGGAWRYCMKGPDGTEAWAKAVYREISPPERLAYLDSFTDADGTVRSDLPQLPVVIDFSESGGRTTVTFRTTFKSAAQRDQLVDMGMLEGLGMSLDKLDAHLASDVEASR
jgi:uncharacterized protein YndB with AHSA1/START domain